MSTRPNPKPAEANEMMLLMQRLRTLQLRLSAVDPVAAQEAEERVLNWRAFVGEMKAREARRRRLHGCISEAMNQVTLDFGQRLEEKLLPRLSESFRILAPVVESRAATVSGMRALELEDEFTGRLSALERRNMSADSQLAELRAACADVYKRCAEVNESIDQIWTDQNPEGLGGWRQTVDKATKEKESKERSPLQAFKEDSILDESELEGPSWVGLTCPSCNEPTGRRKHREGFKDDLIGLLGIAPYWCPRCMVRFYRRRTSKIRRTRSSV
jgi:hypothetical protein